MLQILSYAPSGYRLPLYVCEAQVTTLQHCEFQAGQLSLIYLQQTEEQGAVVCGLEKDIHNRVYSNFPTKEARNNLIGQMVVIGEAKFIDNAILLKIAADT